MRKGIRGVGALAGVFVAALALAAPALRRPDGSLLPLAWTVTVGGLCLVLVAASSGTRWRRCAGLLALALMGQACALGLVDAPPYAVLQHYAPWSALVTPPRSFLLLGLVIQTAIVFWSGRGLAGRTEARVLAVFPVGTTIVVLAVLGFAAAVFSREPLLYAGEVALAGWVFLVNALNLILLAAALPADVLARHGSRLSAGSAEGGSRRLRGGLVPWGVAAWVVLVSAALAWAVFKRIPHIPDDVMYLFQAKYFAHGFLYLPAPPDAAAFELRHTINDGSKWYGIGPPAWPAVLAVGVRLGIPWLVNPLLAGVTILLTHALVRRLYDRWVAGAAVLLLALSPWFLFVSASFMTHPLSVVFTLGSLLAVERARESGGARWGAAAGTCLGGLLLTRPIEGGFLALPIGLWALGLGATRLPWRALAALGLATALVGGLNLPYNQALTGHPTYFPITKWTDETWYLGANRLGFGPDIGWHAGSPLKAGWVHLDPLPGHGPVDVVINANQNMYMLNVELFGWVFGSLAFALLLVAWRRWVRSDWLLLGMIAAIVGGFSFYWFSGGPDFGARYWYQTLIPLVVLTARGIQECQRRWMESGGTAQGALRIGALVAAASLAAFVNYVPWRGLDKYHNFRGMSADMARLARAHDFGRSLVFVREGSQYDYAAAAVFNPPTLHADGTIYARDVGPAGRIRVARNFPDRPIWFVAGAPVPVGPFRLIAGPLPPRSAEAVGGRE
jgi:hypothetical protein